MASDEEPVSGEEPQSALVSSIMAVKVISIGMDTTLGTAMNVCVENRIRHLPVLDDDEKLVGLLTDRDIRASISPRLGSLSENNADRESLRRHVHVTMIRDLITAYPEMPLAKAASLMLEHRIGCLPVIDKNRHLVGIVTTSDFLRLVAGCQSQAPEPVRK